MRFPVLLAPLALLCASVSAQDFSNDQHPTPAPDPRLQEANSALDAHDFERALKLLTPLAEAHPADARILYDLGLTQDALDQGAAAEHSYRAAIADDAKFLEPHIALGLLLARNDRFNDARVELLAVKTVPSDDVALRARAFRALARIDQNPRPSDARDELLEALKLTPETPSDILLGAELASDALHGAEAAELAYRRYLAAQPNDPAGTSELAHLLVTELRSDEAEALLAAALKAHPNDPALAAQLAAIYIHANKNADAIPLLAQVYEANPHDANVGHMLAGLYRSFSDYTHAEPILAGLAAQNPHDASLVDERARALIQLNRSAEAQQILARVVAQPALFPTPADLGNAAGDLAFAASRNNDPAAALQALQVRATVLPTSAAVLFLTAISHDKLHHVKLATEAYKQFLEASKGTNPDEEFEARHRLITLEHMK
jgi:Flp pilus assembly protein TadD